MRRLILIVAVLALGFGVPAYAHFGGFPFGQQKFGQEAFGTGYFGQTAGGGVEAGSRRVTPGGDVRVTTGADTRVVP